MTPEPTLKSQNQPSEIFLVDWRIADIEYFCN